MRINSMDATLRQTGSIEHSRVGRCCSDSVEVFHHGQSTTEDASLKEAKKVAMYNCKQMIKSVIPLSRAQLIK